MLRNSNAARHYYRHSTLRVQDTTSCTAFVASNAKPARAAGRAANKQRNTCNQRLHLHIMTQLGIAIRMYVEQSRKASVVQPGHVQRLGSWLRVCNTQQVIISTRLVAWTASQASAAPIKPSSALQHGIGTAMSCCLRASCCLLTQGVQTLTLMCGRANANDGS